MPSATSTMHTANKLNSAGNHAKLGRKARRVSVEKSVTAAVRPLPRPVSPTQAPGSNLPRDTTYE